MFAGLFKNFLPCLVIYFLYEFLSCGIYFHNPYKFLLFFLLFFTTILACFLYKQFMFVRLSKIFIWILNMQHFVEVFVSNGGKKNAFIVKTLNLIEMTFARRRAMTGIMNSFLFITINFIWIFRLFITSGKYEWSNEISASLIFFMNYGIKKEQK